MVAFFVSAAVVAFKPGQSPIQNGQTRLAQLVSGVGKAVALAEGKTVADIQLIGGQHVHHVMRARMEQRERCWRLAPGSTAPAGA